MQIPEDEVVWGGEKLSTALNDLEPIEIMPLTANMANMSAEINTSLARQGTLIGMNVIYNAATAISYGFKLVTTNSTHFPEFRA